MAREINAASWLVAVGVGIAVMGGIIATLALRLVERRSVLLLGPESGDGIDLLPGGAAGDIFVVGVVTVGLGLLAIAVGVAMLTGSDVPRY